MKVNKFIVGFLFVIAGLFTSVSAAYACDDCLCDYNEPESTIVTYDYLYDYNTSHWIRVNSSVDYVPCMQASQLVLDLRAAGFNVSYYGSWNCPRKITYGVFHDSFYVSGFNYHNHWMSHHHAFHHSGVKVYFHYNTYHNRRHHYHGYGTHYVTKSYYKTYAKKKYTKWKKHHYKRVPVYHTNKKKVTYSKRSYKGKHKGYNSILPRSKNRNGNRGTYKGNGNYKKGKGSGSMRTNYNKGSRGSARANKGHNGRVKSNKGHRGSNKGKYSNRGKRSNGKKSKHRNQRRVSRN
jgi:hypothetical protein